MTQQAAPELWGEPHGHADHATEIMFYGPRDDEELRLVLSLLRDSVSFAREGHG